MNERLYELINRCFIGTTDGKLSDLNTVANIEKFAELIVEECAERIQGCHLVLERDGEFERGYKKAINKATSQVLLHFGVEQ